MFSLTPPAALLANMIPCIRCDTSTALIRLCWTCHLPTRCPMLYQVRPLRAVLRGGCIPVPEWSAYADYRVIREDINSGGHDAASHLRTVVTSAGCPNIQQPGVTFRNNSAQVGWVTAGSRYCSNCERCQCWWHSSSWYASLDPLCLPPSRPVKNNNSSTPPALDSAGWFHPRARGFWRWSTACHRILQSPVMPRHVCRDYYHVQGAPMSNTRVPTWRLQGPVRRVANGVLAGP